MKRTEYREASWKFPFVLYSPEKQAEKLPLILQLHGAGERGNGAEELDLVDVNGFSRYLAGEGKDSPCLVAMPQCPKETFWPAHVESILAFLEQLMAAFPVDPDRVYLTGMSMGGYGTWFTAMEKPEAFAAIAPVCGGGMAWNVSRLTMPIWTFHGTLDPVVPLSQTEQMVQALRDCGADVRYTRLEGVAHGAWDHTYDADLMNWLLQHKKA